MRDLIRDYLPWLLSVVTIYQIYIAGSLKQYAWAVAIGNQALWLIWIISASAWGLLPMNVAMWIVCTRNHLKWRKDAQNN